jgi:hypothetical protein
MQGMKGRRHEVGFGDALVRVEIYSGEETVEVFQHPAWLGAWRGFVSGPSYIVST